MTDPDTPEVPTPNASDSAESTPSTSDTETSAPVDVSALVGMSSDAPEPEPAPLPKPAVPVNGFIWGTGRRKTSVARVRLKAGTGQFIVNGKPVNEFFSTHDTRRSAVEPLVALELSASYDV